MNYKEVLKILKDNGDFDYIFMDEILFREKNSHRC